MDRQKLEAHLFARDFLAKTAFVLRSACLLSEKRELLYTNSTQPRGQFTFGIMQVNSPRLDLATGNKIATCMGNRIVTVSPPHNLFIP